MAIEMEKVVVVKPKAGVFRKFIRNIRKNFWIDPSVVIEKDRVSRWSLPLSLEFTEYSLMFSPMPRTGKQFMS
jgi:hypothetical protein